MANPDKARNDDEKNPLSGPFRGEPSDSAEANRKANWRERYPGWETFDGKPNDPRFEGCADPNKDPRFDTNLHEESTLPHGSASMWVWLIILGVVLMTLFAIAMFRRFQQPSPRSPDQSQTLVVPELGQNTRV